MRPKAEWAIDSEPIRAPGIIVKEPFHSRTQRLFKFSIY